MAQSLKFQIIDPVGLYATPATELVDTVKRFYSHITMKYDRKEVNLKSMMGVLSLGVPSGAMIEITIDGEDENRALSIIREKLKDLGIARMEG